MPHFSLSLSRWKYPALNEQKEKQPLHKMIDEHKFVVQTINTNFLNGYIWFSNLDTKLNEHSSKHYITQICLTSCALWSLVRCVRLFVCHRSSKSCLAQLLKRGTSFKLIHIGIEVTSISMLTSETTFSTFMFALYFTLIHSISLRHLRVKVNFGGANFAMKFARPNLISHKNQKQENCKK